MSFGSPLPARRLLSSRKFDLPSSSNPEPGSELRLPEQGSDPLEDEEMERQDVNDEDEQTVVIKKTSCEPLSPSSPASEPEPPSPARSSTNDTPSRSKKIRVKVNNEVERIVVSGQCRLAHSTVTDASFLVENMDHGW
jgi:hypothetical protein